MLTLRIVLARPKFKVEVAQAGVNSIEGNFLYYLLPLLLLWSIWLIQILNKHSRFIKEFIMETIFWSLIKISIRFSLLLKTQEDFRIVLVLFLDEHDFEKAK